MKKQPETKRFLGLELAGAKNDKTTLVALEFYPKERKIFVLDVHEGIGPSAAQSGDQALIHLLRQYSLRTTLIGVNAAMQLPSCLECPRKRCTSPEKCTIPSVKWVRACLKQAAKSHDTQMPALRGFTPYTQRPVEVWLRYFVVPRIGLKTPLDIDETLGGAKAALTARMVFLRGHLRDLDFVEVMPKLTVHLLARECGISTKRISQYRQLDQGVFARAEILEKLSVKKDLFIYERDQRRLADHLGAFDAFICALTALLSDERDCAAVPQGFPVSSGWIEYPRLRPEP